MSMEYTQSGYKEDYKQCMREVFKVNRDECMIECKNDGDKDGCYVECFNNKNKHISCMCAAILGNKSATFWDVYYLSEANKYGDIPKEKDYLPKNYL